MEPPHSHPPIKVLRKLYVGVQYLTIIQGVPELGRPEIILEAL
jgi:hypothetical protein